MLISYQVKVEEVMQMHSYNHFLLLLISLGAVFIMAYTATQNH